MDGLIILQILKDKILILNINIVGKILFHRGKSNPHRDLDKDRLKMNRNPFGRKLNNELFPS